MLTMWMGHDPREAEAYDVAMWSFYRRTTKPLAVKPLKLGALNAAGIVTRPVERNGGKLWCPISQAPMATEFAISRFAVPFLGPREGFALFVDCDVLALDDVAVLFAEADPSKAIQVVKHSHDAPTETVKMDGVPQTAYSRKNWSSVMLWNLAHPAHDRLTLDMLNTLPGRDLHRFCWLQDDEIGDLHPRWNWLVNVEAYPGAGIAHYTLGGPWFDSWQPQRNDDTWLAERAAMRSFRMHASAA